jgi:transmembrane sensor
MKEKVLSDSLIEAIQAYYSNHLTQSQTEELMGWINADKENLRFFREIGTIWYISGQTGMKKIDIEKDWNKLVSKINKNGIRKIPGPEIRIPSSMAYWIAASILILLFLGIGSFYFPRNGRYSGYNECFEATAPKGSRSFITLYDGSKVWLNSGTKLKLKRSFGIKDRNLSLEGEAYFEVASNKNLPFRVNTSDICITATGTAFNVKAYNEENIIETTLEKGEVRIDELKPSKNKTESDPVYLKPNQKAVFTKSNRSTQVNDIKKNNENNTINNPVSRIQSAELKIDSLVDTKLTTSWKDSKWIFKSSKLQTLAPILERRFDITISFRDSILHDYKFTGIIKDESLEQVLKAISLAAPIKYEINHKQVIMAIDQNQQNNPLRSFRTNK